MKSMNGHIAWQHLIPDLVPFTRFGKEKLLLYTQRTTAHFPHPPQCVVIGRNKVNLILYHVITLYLLALSADILSKQFGPIPGPT